MYEGNRFGRKQQFILKITIWNCKLVDYERTVEKNFWGGGGRKRDREKEIIKRCVLLDRKDIRYSVCACFYQNMCTHIHVYDWYRIKRCKKIDKLHQVPPINLRYYIKHSEFTKKKEDERKEIVEIFSLLLVDKSVPRDIPVTHRHVYYREWRSRSLTRG
jgi:hypothetical protein